MNDPSCFTNLHEYYTFIYAISYMMLVEVGIWIYNFRGWLRRLDKKNSDYGTLLIVMLGCWGSFYFVYRYIRNPAYAGTMLSMLGNAFCFRSAFSPFIVLLILAVCYGIRIKVEEKALYECFGEDFKNYCFRSWRLIPLIW